MKVKIKTWDAMEKEFELDAEGDINCRMYFTTEMEECLPKNRIIEVTDPNKKGIYNWYYDEDEYLITDDMIEEIIKD
jgi:hypothetical protein